MWTDGGKKDISLCVLKILCMETNRTSKNMPQTSINVCESRNYFFFVFFYAGWNFENLCNFRAGLGINKEETKKNMIIFPWNIHMSKA